MKTTNQVTLAPIRPNLGIETAFRKALLKLVDELHNSIAYWIAATYKANPPEMAQDESPSLLLRALMKRLGVRWSRKLNEAAPKLAKHFSEKIADRSDAALATMLKDAGFTVEFTMTTQMRDVMQANVGEQVSLIQSIGEQHLKQVEGLVMRSVSEGRNVKYLADELEKRYKLTRKRAVFIARDQNNKATALLNRVRQQQLGIKQAVWMHSHAGKHPRPSHVKANGEPYDIDKGMYLEGKWVWPGTEINCRCTSKAILPGITDI